MADPTGQNFFLGLTTNAPEVVQIYITALNEAKSAGAQVGQVFQSAATQVSAGADKTTESLLKLKAAADALKQANAAVASAGPAVTLAQGNVFKTTQSVAGFTSATQPIPLSYAEGLRAAEQATKGATDASTTFSKQLIDQAFVSKEATAALKAASAAAAGAGPALPHIPVTDAQRAALQQAVAGASRAITGPVTGEGLRFPSRAGSAYEDITHYAQLQFTLDKAIGGNQEQLRKAEAALKADLDFQMAVDQAFGRRVTQMTDLAAAMKSLGSAVAGPGAVPGAAPGGIPSPRPPLGAASFGGAPVPQRYYGNTFEELRDVLQSVSPQVRDLSRGFTNLGESLTSWSRGGDLTKRQMDAVGASLERLAPQLGAVKDQMYAVQGTAQAVSERADLSGLERKIAGQASSAAAAAAPFEKSMANIKQLFESYRGAAIAGETEQAAVYLRQLTNAIEQFGRTTVSTARQVEGASVRAEAKTVGEGEGIAGGFMSQFLGGFRQEQGLAAGLGAASRITLEYGVLYSSLFALAGFLKQSVQTFSDFQIAIQDLADITGQSAAQVTDFAKNIADIGAQFGIASDQAVQVAAQTRGVYPDASQLAISQASKSVFQTALITGQQATDVSQAADAIALAFNQSAQSVLDASNAFDRKLGVLQPTLNAQAQVATGAREAGFSQSELAAMFSLLSARLNRNPQDIASALQQVFNRTDIVDLTKFGATAGASFAQQMKQISQLGLSEQTLKSIAVQFGRGPAETTAMYLLQHAGDVTKLAQQPTAGKTEELAAARMTTLSGATTELKGRIEALANTIGGTGVYGGLVALAVALKQVVDLLNALLSPLSLIPAGLRNLAFGALELAGAFALLGKVIKIRAAGELAAEGETILASRGFGTLARGGEDVAAAAGVKGLLTKMAGGAESSALRVGLGRAGLAALSVVKGFGPLGVGITATMLSLNTMKDITEASSIATDALRKSLENTTSTSDDMADASRLAAESLKDQSVINRLVTSGQQKGLSNLADLTQSISDIQLTPTGLVEKATQQLDTSNITTVFQQLMKEGSSAADALRASVTAAAIQTGGTIPGAPGGGVVDRAKAELSKLAGMPQAGIPAERVTFGGIPLWQPKDIQRNLSDEGKAIIEQAKNVLLQKVQAGQKLTQKDIDQYIDAIINAYAIPESDQERVRNALRAASQGALKNIEGLPNLLSDQTALIVNKYSKAINDGTSGMLFNARSAAGKDLKYQPSEVKKAFQKLALGDVSQLQKGGKILPLQQEINELKAAMETALAQGNMQEYANLVTLLSTAENQLATEIIGPAAKTLAAAFGDLTKQGKTKAEMAAMTASIEALIPKIASSSDAMIALLTGMDSATRAIVRASIIADRDVAKVALDNAKKKAASYSIGGPYAFIGDLANALAGKNKVTAAVTQAQANLDALNKQLDAFDKAMSATPVGVASASEKVPKEPKQPKPKKQDTQAQIDAARALAAATRIQDPVKIAAAQLQVAQADLAATAAASGRNSVAYWTAMAGVYKAMQDLADAQVQAAHNARLLHIDVTNPVQAAQEEYNLALAHLNSLRKQGASQNALNPAQADVQAKQAALEAAQFQQVISNLQTNEQLKRITHTQYMQGLQAELDRLKAQQAMLTKTSTGFQQLQDQIDQVEGLMQTAADSVSQQFNLGNIKMPTVYEVRRFMDSAFQGLNYLAKDINKQMAAGFPAQQPSNTSNDNRSVIININGGDLKAVTDAVTAAAGTQAVPTVGLRTRKF